MHLRRMAFRMRARETCMTIMMYGAILQQLIMSGWQSMPLGLAIKEVGELHRQPGIKPLLK